VFSTLAHHVSGAPATPDVTPTDIPAKTPTGETATLRRWVLQKHVWTELLTEADFTDIDIDTLPAGRGPRAARTLLVRAVVPHPS
jgi:hypothetical protein